jgi:hypothetical protein
MRSEPHKAPLIYPFHNKKWLYNVRNLPETPIIFLVYSPKSYKMSTDTRIWAQTDAYERISGLFYNRTSVYTFWP